MVRAQRSPSKDCKLREAQASKQTPGKALAAYLVQTGWSQSELARRAGINPSAICRAIKHGAALGRLAALQIERATVDAKRRRETSVEALRVEHLHCSPATSPPTPTQVPAPFAVAIARVSARRGDPPEVTQAMLLATAPAGVDEAEWLLEHYLSRLDQTVRAADSSGGARRSR